MPWPCWAVGSEARDSRRPPLGASDVTTYALIPGGGGDPVGVASARPRARGPRPRCDRCPAARRGRHGGLVRVRGQPWSTPSAIAPTSSSSPRRWAASPRRSSAPGAESTLLVLLNAMIPMPGETFNAWGTNTGSGAREARVPRQPRAVAREADDDAVIYYHDLPSELRAEAQARTWQDQSTTPLDEPWPLERVARCPDPSAGRPP